MSTEKMSTKEYYFWVSAIRSANELADKDSAKAALRAIHMQLAAKYGYQEDVRDLLKKFRYDV